MATCFHCGGNVVWDADFDFDDYCLEEQGIVHVCHCTECGAMIEYYVPDDPDDSQPKKTE